MFKFNKRGEYTYFPGVTIISAVDPRQLDLWRHVHQCLSTCELTLPHYALLPFESYHMTAINLFVEALHPIENALSWGDFLRSKRVLFNQLDQFCKKNQFTPEVEIVDIQVRSSIRLHLRLPEHQANLIKSFAHQFNLTAGMPEVFHMTLAYNYRACSPLEKQLISDQIKDKLHEIFHSYQEGLRLLTPTLSYFRDMTAFVPWDGQDYPFMPERVRSPVEYGRAAFFHSIPAAVSLPEETETKELK